MNRSAAVFAITLMLLGSLAEAQHPDQTPFECSFCDGWNQPVEPYGLTTHAWFVGTRRLGSVLIADPGTPSQGLVLIDGALPQSAARIIENIQSLGLDPSDVQWILVSHAHFDHAGGVAALARITGAQIAAGKDAVVGLTTGLFHPDDPQKAFGEDARFPDVAEVRGMKDGETLNLGDLTITAVATPGHTPGGMSWTWPVCDAAGDCRQAVYLDSLNAVSAPGYRFTDHPEMLDRLRSSIDRIAALPCDIASAAHPDQISDATPDTTACAEYAASAERRLKLRLQQESR